MAEGGHLMTEEKYEFYDFPTEPIGGGNPYYMCASCGRSVPEINYRIDGHLKDCEWAKKKRAELAGEKTLHLTKVQQIFLSETINTWLAHRYPTATDLTIVAQLREMLK
jgi:hypothetical protein